MVKKGWPPWTYRRGTGASSEKRVIGKKRGMVHVEESRERGREKDGSHEARL